MRTLPTLTAVLLAASPLAAATVSTLDRSPVVANGHCSVTEDHCMTIIIPDVVWPDGSVSTFDPIVIKGRQ